ncbi:putative ribonuclease H-like domain-containing protein [Tanacetum coccineum]
MTHPHPKRSFVPQAVLTRSGKLSTAGAEVNTVRPVNTANTKAVNTVRPVNTASSKPIGNPKQKKYKEKAVIDSGGSKHMTENKCYLDEYKDYDGGFVSFTGGKGRISGKSKIKTGSLDFDDAKIDESNTWHRRLGHINFKTMNKLVKGNLVKGLPSKIFENDHSCVACKKGKQHKASYKTKLVNSISKPLHMLHMDLFGLTNVKSLMKRSYCLVVTDDFSRFSWVFFLATKDETSRILKTFITEIENQLDHKVKVIRYDNGTEFKNSIMNQFCEMKGIKREFSVARTPQQNGVAERKNRTLIEAARTMDHLGKFDGKADEGYFVGYSVVSKAMRVFNKRTRIVEETLNIRFLENTPNVKGNGPDWLFDVDSLTISMNYVPVVAGNKTNGPMDSERDAGIKPTEVDENEALDTSEKHDQATRSDTPVSTAGPSFDNAVPSPPVNTAGPSVSTANAFEEHLFEIFSPFKNAFTLPPVPNVSSMDNTGIFGNAYDDKDVEEGVDMNNVISSYTVPDSSFTKFHKDHHEDQVIRSLKTHVQTRQMTKINEEHGLISSIHKLHPKWVLVIKPHNKTPYKLIRGRPLLIDFMKPFGCPVTILNTRDHLGKFDGKVDEGYFVGYYVLFNVDSLTISMNYVPVVVGNQTNGIAETKDNIVTGQAQKEKEPEQEYILIPLCTTNPLISQSPKHCEGDAGMKPTEVDENEASDKSGKHDQATRSESERLNQREMQTEHTNSTNSINTVSTPVNTDGPSVSTANAFEEHLFERFSPFKNAFTLPPVPNVSSMDNTGIFGNAYNDEDVEEEVDMNNVVSSYTVPDSSFTKFHKDHPEDQVIGSLKTPVQTRQMTKINEEHGLISSVHKLRRTNHKDFQNCLFACFLSQMEPKKPVKDMWAIGTKWVFRNKKDERGIVVNNKAILVAQGHTQEEGIDYDEVFAPIEEEVYVYQPPGFEDLHFPDKVYKVEKALFGLHQALRACLSKDIKHSNRDKQGMIKDKEVEDVDVHLYRSMIGSLMYLTAFRPDIMFVVYACASDYAGASLNRKSTIGGCQFIGKRLISWQCKKQTIVANSTTKAEYVAAANCCGQVFWIQNHMLDYGFNLMNNKIYIDNESTIRIVKNPVFYSKTKHMEIRHYFIRDSYEKKLIQVIKIHTDQNVANLLTKTFDASRFNFLTASIGLLYL